jgi:UDP-hydrolysing UDP-N-acetyl-D-glucosamine 2-epimerase
MGGFIGKFIQLLVKKIKKIKPDIILLLGDRAEMLAGAIVGVYLSIPVAHIHGGERTSTVDEMARHAISKLSHIHFVATEDARNRLLQMGEDKRRIFISGAPGLSSILRERLYSAKEITAKYRLDFKRPFFLVLQHPVTAEVEDSARQMQETLEAIRELGHQAVVIYPNADAGGRQMVRVIKRYRKFPFIRIYKSLPRKDYLSLLRAATALIGNSSSGIIEAPAFKLAAVNIGSRQDGRERAANLIDVGYDKEQISSAIRKIIRNKDFKNTVKRCKSVYGDGKAAGKITRVLSKIRIGRELLNKQIVY